MKERNVFGKSIWKGRVAVVMTLLLLLGTVWQNPLTALATGENLPVKNCTEIQLTNITTVESVSDRDAAYTACATANGSIRVWKNGADVNVGDAYNAETKTATFAVTAGESWTFEVIPDAGYRGNIMVDGARESARYSFLIGEVTGAALSVWAEIEQDGGQNPPPDGGGDGQNPPPQVNGTFSINGVDCQVTQDTNRFTVPSNFDFNSLKVIVRELNGTQYTGDGFASGTMFDEQNRDAMEIMIHHKEANILQLGILFHNDSSGNVSGYPGFYLTQITLVKDSYRGVGAVTDNVPDMYSFDSFQKVDLRATTAAAPGHVTAYYGDDTITLTSDTGNAIFDIQPGAGIPAGAITIDVQEGTVQIHSNYYTSIPLTVTLSDGTVGYMQIDRIGLDVQMYQRLGAGQDQSSEILHGASSGNNAAIPQTYYGQSIFTATFYHPATQNYTDYNMIATIKMSDGTTQTRVVEGFSTIPCTDADLGGSDYIVWSGPQFSFDDPVYPVSVSVTAVKAGAVSNTAFGGASFGSGAGVSWTKR